MKRIFNLVLVATLIFGAASCSKEDVLDQGTNTGNTIVFTIPAKSGIMTYADPNPAGTVTANEHEVALDGASIKIYMFDATTSKLQAIITPTMGTIGSNKSATITLDNTWADYSNPKHFYLVANPTTYAGALAGVTASADLTGTPTALVDFLKLAASTQGATLLMPDKATPATFLMMTEQVENVSLASTTKAEVYFRRNVARFDIDNQVNTVGANAGGNVVIEAVKIYDANLQGYIFGYEKSSETNLVDRIMAAPATGDFAPVNVTATVNAATGKQAQPSLFYLYPTVIKDGGTQISLVGKVQGVSKVFTLKGGAGIEIKANSRYRISAIDANTLTFSIEVADWDEGEEIVGQPDNSGFGLTSAPAIVGGVYSSTGNTIEVNPATAFSANFEFMASSTKGVIVEVLPQSVPGFVTLGDTKVIVSAVSTDATATYAAPYFKSSFTVTVTSDTFTAAESFVSFVKVTDISSGAYHIVSLWHHNTTDANVYYPGTHFKSIRLQPTAEYTPVLWAPVNVGAITIDKTNKLSDVGYLFQWGKNYGSIVGKAGDLIAGPVSALNAFGIYSNRFITSEGANFLLIKDNTLWNSTTGPCPKGWRLPKGDDLNGITVTGTPIIEGFNVIVKGDGGAEIHFPRNGQRNNNNGEYADQVKSGLFWTYETSGEGAWGLSATSTGFKFHEAKSRASGLSVRCVKSI